MKKLIALALSVMMVMSLVVIPVAAEEAAVEAVRDANVHITAATVNDTPLVNSWEKVPVADGTTLNSGNGYYVTNNAGTTATINMALYNAAIDADNGFKVKADNALTSVNLNEAIGGTSTGITVSTGTDFNGKPMRADSVRFKFPEIVAEPEMYYESVLVLFGYDHNSYCNNQGLAGKNTLRIKNGGAYASNMDAYASFIDDGTLKADTWYRAERILDTRIDNGETAENWSRYIIYDDATGAVLGDSGWVMTGTKVKSAVDSSFTGNANYPFRFVSYGAFNFPADTYAYFDDLKSWALDAPSGEYTVGDASQYPRFLTVPATPKAMYGNNFGISYSLNWTHYLTWTRTGDYPNGMTADADLMKNKLSKFGTAMKSNYIYLQEDFMIPELNTRNFGLMDLNGSKTWNTTPGQARTYNSPIKVKNGVLSVEKWDAETSNYVDTATLEGGTEPWTLTLELGKWYTACLVVEQSAAYTTNPVDKTLATTAQVIITDGDTTYTTEKFTYKSPSQYLDTNSGTTDAVIMADGERTSWGTTPDGFKVNLDNQTMVYSNTTMDAEDAYVVFDEDFQSRDEGATFDSFAWENLNPAGETYKSIGNSGINGQAAVSVDRTKVEGIPTSATIVLGENIKGDTATLTNALKLYQGETEVPDMLTGATYDAATKTLTVNFAPLYPETEYTIKLDRAAALVDGDIFSAIPGADGKVAEFTFTTGASDTATLVYTPVFKTMGISIEDVGEFASMPISSASTLKSYNSDPTSYVAIAALYSEDGWLADMMAQTGTIPAKGEVTVDFEGETISSPYAVTLKSFVWNTWSLMEPIADAYVYPAAQ